MLEILAITVYAIGLAAAPILALKGFHDLAIFYYKDKYHGK